MDIEDKVSNISLDGDASSTHRHLSSASSSSHALLDTETRQRFMQLVTRARQLTEDGDIAGALKLNEKALTVHFSEKLQRRVDKMKAFLSEQDKSDDDGGDGQMKQLGQGFMLHTRLHRKLYTHQREGVLWMWSLFLRGKGGILADDMGLGKTIQVIAFLAGMFDMNKIKSVMIVVPLSVLPNWLTEFRKWTPGISVLQFHGNSKKEKERALNRVRTRGGVLMTTYGLVVTTKETFAERHGQEFVWDYVILDEGHKIKNPTKTSKSIHHIPARHRLILTGTPVQNNLKELWSLFDYVHQGSLLGTVRTFKMEFETPIIRARERDATAVEKRLGQEMAQTLKLIIQPYFLRRTKAEVSDGKAGVRPDDAKMPTMTRKNDLVIWLHLTETQQKIYQDFINLDHVKELLMTKKSPLVALTVLKKICDHPRLLSTRACLQLGLDGDNFDEEELEQPESYESAVTQINKISDDVLIQESGKMQILVTLLDTFKEEGHRTLIFSQSRKLLNIIQKVITNRGHKIARLDGRVTSLSDRDEIVKKFQRDGSISVFLLTVQVGGVGLTITSADRVIIYDPSWNPATDAQAVDRAYRIGQDKNVIVYRLITCGTVEEKIYRRQVFKDSITRQTTGSNTNPYRYFTKMELRELFTLDDPRFSKTQRQLQNMHEGQRETDTALDEHIAFLHSLDIFGISDHDLMFKQTTVRDDEDVEMVTADEVEEQHNENFIQNKVMKAQMLLAEENTGIISYDDRTKGMMRYPPSNPARTLAKPSPLFTQVSDSPPSEEEEEDENGEISSNNLAHQQSQETIDLTKVDCGDSTVDVDAEMPSPGKKSPSSLSCSLSLIPDKERRILQPLTPEEVRQRSPCTASVTKADPIMVEELLISPDTRSPIISFQKMPQHQRTTGASRNSSSSPSKSGQESPKSHLKQGMGSPKSRLKHGVMPPFGLSGSSPRSEQSLDKVVTTKSESSLQRTFPSASTSTPLAPEAAEVLAEDTPGSGRRSSSSQSSFSSHDSKHLDLSQVSRKLSFVVEDSADDSDEILEESPCSVTRKKHRSHADMSLDSPKPLESFHARLSLSGDKRVECSRRDLQKPGSFQDSKNDLDLENAEPDLPKSSQEVGSLKKMFVDSPRKKLFMDSPKKKQTTNKRRSVCVQKLMIDDSLDGDSNISPSRKSWHSQDAVFSEEDDDDVVGENKENEPVSVRYCGGRNRIVSDSESGQESCFEVEDSEEEDGRLQEKFGPIDSSSVITESDSREQGTGSKEINEVDSVDEEEEGDDDDDELNERFQNLISVARTMYKQKNYTESLLYVEEALSIFQEPDLQEMADKIRTRIQTQV